MQQQLMGWLLALWVLGKLIPQALLAGSGYLTRHEWLKSLHALVRMTTASPTSTKINRLQNKNGVLSFSLGLIAQAAEALKEMHLTFTKYQALASNKKVVSLNKLNV
jgi:hypothetical protein